MSEEKKITLKSQDGETFEVTEAVALQSQTIKHIIEDNGASNDVITVHNVKGEVLAKVIEYCKKHADSDDGDIKQWDAEFVTADFPTLFDLSMAANYLNVKSLLNLTCKTIADMIKDKSPEEVREIFNIKNDFTPEEEEFMRRDNQWAFD